MGTNALSQEWTKKDAGRNDYVRDRTDCVQQAQKMALVGDELQKDVLECLASKGWQRNQSDTMLEMYCEENENRKMCKRGASADVLKKDRAECLDYTLKTVGNTYHRPGGWGLIGLMAASSAAEENKRNLERSQIATMKICLEGKGWAVELRGEVAKKMENGPQPGESRSPAPGEQLR